MAAVLGQLAERLEQESAKRESIRTAVKALDQHGRFILASLQSIHAQSNVQATCEAVKRGLAESLPLWQQLASEIPPSLYYKYNDMFKQVLQQYIFYVCFLSFAESNQFASFERVQSVLGIPAEVQTEFHFDIEDYLFGLANLSPELSRWAVNCVIHGDFQRPFVISAFLAELLSSFQQLNLKNDALRRKYDGIKYDVKKVEEVVYDIRVRNLGAPQ